MTTAAWSTVLDQSSDAGFRAWGSELNTKFGSVGMVQTADTGQINWSTATRTASTNTAVGYEIWKLSSGNLYFKIEYGTGQTASTSPSMWLTVGTGSNGSGTLTGQLSTRTQVGTGTNPTSTVTNYQSYLCATANYFALSWKIASSGTANRARTFYGVCQTVDATGAATTVGYLVALTTTNSSIAVQAVATTAAVTGTQIGTSGASPNVMFIPLVQATPANSLDGAGNNQAFLWWHSIFGTCPMTPLLHMASVLATDLAVGATASMTLVGSTPHTYLDCGVGQLTDATGNVGAAQLGLLMLYE